jgi:hypothetical protein
MKATGFVPIPLKGQTQLIIKAIISEVFDEQKLFKSQ